MRDAQTWSQGKSLSDLDYQFLAKSQEIDRLEVQQALEAERLKEVEARLGEERRRLVQEKKAAKRQRFLLAMVSVALFIAIASASDDKTVILWNSDRVLNADILAYGCVVVRDYLRTNAQVEESDRHLCDRI